MGSQEPAPLALSQDVPDAPTAFEPASTTSSESQPVKRKATSPHQPRIHMMETPPSPTRPSSPLSPSKPSPAMEPEANAKPSSSGEPGASSKSRSSRAAPPTTNTVPSPPTHELITFYECSSSDHQGRLLSQILTWNWSKLESSHDYIQTLFPLPENSVFGWRSPLITREVLHAFRSRPDLRSNLRKALGKMIWFYGFNAEFDGGEITIEKHEKFARHSRDWNCSSDHNHNRISRIIRCCRLLGLGKEALAFWETIREAGTRVGGTSKEYWRRAAERSLNLRPDLQGVDEQDGGIGPRFLREFVAAERERARGAEEAKNETGEDGEWNEEGEWGGIKSDGDDTAKSEPEKTEDKEAKES